jgi:hypothetical protein
MEGAIVGVKSGVMTNPPVVSVQVCNSVWQKYGRCEQAGEEERRESRVANSLKQSTITFILILILILIILNATHDIW